MAERKWITRDEIAEIHEQRATMATDEAWGGSLDTVAENVQEIFRLSKQAEGVREIEHIHSPNLAAHVDNTQRANGTGRYAR